MKRINSVEELKEICLSKDEDIWVDCFIALNGGVRSSKAVSWQDNVFVVVNEIDDTDQELTEEQMEDKALTNIGEAIKKGAFFMY